MGEWEWEWEWGTGEWEWEKMGTRALKVLGNLGTCTRGNEYISSPVTMVTYLNQLLSRPRGLVENEY